MLSSHEVAGPTRRPAVLRLGKRASLNLRAALKARPAHTTDFSQPQLSSASLRDSMRRKRQGSA